MEAQTLRLQRFLVAAMLVTSAVGFWYGSYDVFNTFKATVLAAGAVLVLGLSAVRAVSARRIVLPATPVWYPVAGFALALVVATVLAESPLRSLVGRPGRHTGLAMYLAYLLIFALVLRLYRDESPAPLVKSVFVAAVPISVYGIWQAAGFDPLRWTAVIGGPPSTLGNTNFYSAWLGIVIPLFVWGVLSRRLSTEWRAWSGALGVLAVVAAGTSRSLQGPLIAAVGAAIVVAVWLSTRESRKWQGHRAKALAGVGVGAVVLVTAWSVVGSVSDLGGELAGSLTNRVPLWATAATMFTAQPLTGVGLDGYGDWFYRYRPEDWVTQGGAEVYSDSAHSVPLDMLANGGVLLGGAYLAVIVATGWAFTVGLRRLQGEDRLLLGGLGGAWVAYQLQALGSIDVPPLAVLHWVLAGLIIAKGTPPPLRAVAIKVGPGRRGRRPAARHLLLVGIAGATVAALVVVHFPLRADIVAFQAQMEDDPVRALALYDSAAATAPWEPLYPLLAGSFLAGRGELEQALVRYEEAAARHPPELLAHLRIAGAAADLGRFEQAAHAYRRVLELDPKTPEVLAEVGAFRLARGQAQEAVVLLQRAVAADDAQASWWQALGDAHLAVGDAEQARAAHRRAAAVDTPRP